MYPDRWRALFIEWKKEPTESEEGNGQRPGSKNEKTDDRDPRLPSGRTPLPQDPEQRANHNNSGSNDKDGNQFIGHHAKRGPVRLANNIRVPPSNGLRFSERDSK